MVYTEMCLAEVAACLGARPWTTASYGVENPIYALSQLAQTTMRSEIGKMSLDNTFENRDLLNQKIVATINEAAVAWGMARPCVTTSVSPLQFGII